MKINFKPHGYLEAKLYNKNNPKIISKELKHTTILNCLTRKEDYMEEGKEENTTEKEELHITWPAIFSWMS